MKASDWFAVTIFALIGAYISYRFYMAEESQGIAVLFCFINVLTYFRVIVLEVAEKNESERLD